jgi:hypothetical protein
MLEAAGATGINGTTDYDRTNYFETLPVEPARARAVDRIRSHGLPPRHGRIRRRCRTSRTWSATSGARVWRTSPYGIAEEEVVHLLYPKGHPYYGYVIGTHEDIQAAKLEDVKQFFKRTTRRTTPASRSSATSIRRRRARWCRILRQPEARPAGPADSGRDAKITSERRCTSKIASSCPALHDRG